MSAVGMDVQQSGVERVGKPSSLPQFWYSRGTILAILIALFAMVEAVSYVTPPFQSPDEFYHLKRAYLLSRGEILLKSQGNVTGGDIDIGLLEYMKNFEAEHWFAYISPQQPIPPRGSLATEVKWRGEVRFADVPNVAMYFPLPYLPQAIALWIGAHSGLSVSQSYYLARLFSLSAALGLLGLTFVVYPISPFVIALFVIPMTLFQFGSSSLDPVSFSAVALTGALFMRGTDERFDFSSTQHVVLTACLFMLATSRMNLIVLSFIPIAIYRTRGSPAYLVSSGAVAMLSLVWIATVLSTASSGHGNDPATTSEMVKHYLTHPESFARILYFTVINGPVVTFYWRMLVGAFGWAGFDVSGTTIVQSWGVFLKPYTYLFFGLLLLLLGAISMETQGDVLRRRGNWILTVAAVISGFLVFPLLLAMWTPRSYEVIYGVQGRYFIPVLILLGFSLFNRRVTGLRLAACMTIVVLMAILSIASTIPVLRAQYWST